MSNAEKQLFRLQHIIPRELSSAAPVNNPSSSEMDGIPTEEIFIPMTWGKVAAKVWGPPSGRPVFAIHGWLDNAATFDLLFPLLPKDLRIVAVDIAGHGLSSHYPTGISYNFLDCLPAIKRMAAYFNWEKFSFIGHSLGGCMAIMFAGIYPEMVDKVVLLDIVRVQTTFPETMNIRLRKAVDVILECEASILAGPEKPCTYEQAVKRNILGSGGSLDPKDCDVLFKRGLTRTDHGYVFHRDRRLRAAPLMFVPKEDQLYLAKEVTADVLIIKAKDGPYFESPRDYQDQVEALKTKSKRVEYIEVEGKHHVHLSHPERVAPYICNFFTL